KTLTFLFSKFKLSIVPIKFSKGPDVTFTTSLTLKSTGGNTFSCTPKALTSASDKGTGFDAGPTNPVTPLVFLTRYQDSSLIIILTRTYPGNIFLSLTFLDPDLVSIYSSVGTATSKISSFI